MFPDLSVIGFSCVLNISSGIRRCFYFIRYLFGNMHSQGKEKRCMHLIVVGDENVCIQYHNLKRKISGGNPSHASMSRAIVIEHYLIVLVENWKTNGHNTIKTTIVILQVVSARPHVV